MAGKGRVEAWVWPGREPGESGTLSFDPPIARFKKRCVHLVEATSEKEVRRLKRIERAAKMALEGMSPARRTVGPMSNAKDAESLLRRWKNWNEQ